eukprot:8169878-Alexandrium_andersonii.AAC.1
MQRCDTSLLAAIRRSAATRNIPERRTPWQAKGEQCERTPPRTAHSIDSTHREYDRASTSARLKKASKCP